MSIEAMKQALEALKTCRIRSVSEWSVEDITPKNITAAIATLRTAIQQAESEPDDVARDAERWRTFLATRPSNTHEGIIAAIDAACPAQKGGE